MTIKKFDIDFWKKYKQVLDVITEYAEPVEIVKTDCRGKYPILAVIFDGDTDDSCFYTEEGVSMSGSKILLTINPEKFKKYKKRKFIIGAVGCLISFLCVIYQVASLAHAIDVSGKVAFNTVVLLLTAACFILTAIWFTRSMKILDSIDQ